MSKLDGKKVLLVEDEMLLGMLFEDMLVDMGMIVDGPYRTVKTALSGMMAGAAPDVAVLDIDLGPETSNLVADMLTRLEVPYLLVTGFTGAGLLDYDEQDILGKPFTETQLEASLCRLLNGK